MGYGLNELKVTADPDVESPDDALVSVDVSVPSNLLSSARSTKMPIHLHETDANKIRYITAVLALYVELIVLSY